MHSLAYPTSQPAAAAAFICTTSVAPLLMCQRRPFLKALHKRISLSVSLFLLNPSSAGPASHQPPNWPTLLPLAGLGPFRASLCASFAANPCMHIAKWPQQAKGPSGLLLGQAPKGGCRTRQGAGPRYGQVGPGAEEDRQGGRSPFFTNGSNEMINRV